MLHYYTYMIYAHYNVSKYNVLHQLRDFLFLLSLYTLTFYLYHNITTYARQTNLNNIHIINICTTYV